jgi:membrane fusion protein, multidrug efflux system
MKKFFASVALCLAALSASAAEYPAVLAWKQRVILSTPVSGVVTSVPAVAGERVREGQVLVQLDKRPFESALRKAEAQAHKYRLNREEAKRELQRTRELYERTVISVHDLQVEEIAFASADADYASARAELETAQLHLGYATVQAPFAGLVLEVSVAPGETVVNTQQATPMVTLARDRPMTARARVPAEAAGALSPGQSATVKVDGKTYPAKVVQIGAEADASGRYELTVSFDPGDAALRAGLPASIDTGH